MMTTRTWRRDRLLPLTATLAVTALLGAGLVGCGAQDQAADGSHSVVQQAAAYDVRPAVATQPSALTAAQAQVQTAQTAQTASLSPAMAMGHRHHAHKRYSRAALRKAMRALWAQHMEWTYATIAAFAADTPGLSATLDRLLRNQSDIGNAIKPFYGTAAGNALTALLKTHINEAVPILVAAKANDTEALGKAVTAWYANAQAIADFLANANRHWHRAEMRQMMKGHIDQTLGYASSQLQGNYAVSITEYGAAEAHMQEMADMLSNGIIAQFHRKFRR